MKQLVIVPFKLPLFSYALNCFRLCPYASKVSVQPQALHTVGKL